jgi:hypothetical protein
MLEALICIGLQLDMRFAQVQAEKALGTPWAEIKEIWENKENE